MKSKLIPLLSLINIAFFGCIKTSRQGTANNSPSLSKLTCSITKNPPNSFVTTTYDSFPLFVQTLSNKIKLYYRQGTSHIGDNGIIVTRSSADGGATFTTADTLLSEQGVDIRNISGGITATGRIILFVLKYKAPAGTGINQGYIYSDNEGKTWSAYQTLPTMSHPFYSPYGKLINIGDGRIMQAWYGRGGANNYSTYVITSGDNGITWSPPVPVATSTTIQYSEASYAYLDNKVITGLVRDARGAVFHQVISADNGATWSDQGPVTFDTGLMVSPWLSAYVDENGEKYVVAYYANRATENLCAVVGTYSGLKSGVSGWIPSSLTTLGSNTSTDFGYPTVINPCETKSALVVYYKASSASVANLNLFTFTPSY